MSRNGLQQQHLQWAMASLVDAALDQRSPSRELKVALAQYLTLTKKENVT